MEYVRSGEEPFAQFDNLKLRNYFPHEIEKLSVLRVTQTKTFDEVCLLHEHLKICFM